MTDIPYDIALALPAAAAGVTGLRRLPIPALVLRAALLAALWWILTGGHAGAWSVGSVVIALALALSLRLQPPRHSRLSLPGLAGFAAFFLVRSLRAGTQVALMALRPRPDLRPAMLELPLRLPDERERLFLAAVVSLMPGTLCTGLDGDRLQLHVLDVRLPVEAEVRAAEARVARLFAVELQ